MSAAASLKEVLQEASVAFTTGRPGLAVEFNFGSSGQLLRQIEQGAPVDLFVSASPNEVDQLLAKTPGTAATDRRRLAANTLVIVVGTTVPAPSNPGELAAARFDRIAVGNPATVPAGRYAQQAIRSLGLTATLQLKLVFAEDVRQVVEYVARGEAAAGIVYGTDARAFATRVNVGPTFPAASHDPIVYEALVVPAAPHPEPARAFLEFLASDAGGRIFQAHGFAPPPG